MCKHCPNELQFIGNCLVTRWDGMLTCTLSPDGRHHFDLSPSAVERWVSC